MEVAKIGTPKVIERPVVKPCGGCGKGAPQKVVRAAPEVVDAPAKLTGIIGPDAVTRIRPELLAPVADNRHFNPSIIEFRGRTLMAYRAGWFNADIHVAELDARYRPISNTLIKLPHPKCHGGREDPRLFVFRDRLHLCFAGLSYAPKTALTVSVLLASLNDDLSTERIWEPRLAGRNRIEKNWVPFQHDNDLFMVYRGSPHTILKLDVDAGTATVAHETQTPPLFRHGEIRGGCPPVRVGDEYYHWFHSWSRDAGREHYRYTVGVYAFEAKPPFGFTRVTTHPVWLPNTSLSHLNVTPDKDVIYPCGAILRGDTWVVSAGQADHVCEIGEFSRAAIEAAMVAT